MQCILLSIDPSIYNLCIHPSMHSRNIHSSIHPSMHLSICLSNNLSIYQPTNLSIHPSVHLSICQSVHRSIGLSVYLSICLSAAGNVCRASTPAMDGVNGVAFGRRQLLSGPSSFKTAWDFLQFGNHHWSLFPVLLHCFTVFFHVLCQTVAQAQDGFHNRNLAMSTLAIIPILIFSPISSWLWNSLSFQL